MPGETNNTQTFGFETVAVLVGVIKDKGGNVGMKEYELMASLDNSRSASGFDHLFRKVKNRANELLEAKNGGATTTTPKKKGGAGSKNGTPATGEGTGGKKRGEFLSEVGVQDRLLMSALARKPKKDEVEDEESPTKKVKAEVEDEEEEGQSS